MFVAFPYEDDTYYSALVVQEDANLQKPFSLQTIPWNIPSFIFTKNHPELGLTYFR